MKFTFIRTEAIYRCLLATSDQSKRENIFGDSIATQMGLPVAGVPDFAGYAMGYRAVQQYIKRTGKTVAEATFVPATEILSASSFFMG